MVNKNDGSRSHMTNTINLVYGSEVVLPVKVGIPSPTITFYDYNKN